ncbi:MAG: substrate-binding domain-containing protein, partial [Clostridia bacterium]|nr:substrate-binding domain-containing protein [Clostridia bacterium]
FIGSDNYDSGKLAADFISETLGDKQGEVAIIEGNPGDTCAIDRTTGFADEAAVLDNITVVASQTGKWDRLESLNVA